MPNPIYPFTESCFACLLEKTADEYAEEAVLSIYAGSAGIEVLTRCIRLVGSTGMSGDDIRVWQPSGLWGVMPVAGVFDGGWKDRRGGVKDKHRELVYRSVDGGVSNTSEFLIQEAAHG